MEALSQILKLWSYLFSFFDNIMVTEGDKFLQYVTEMFPILAW